MFGVMAHHYRFRIQRLLVRSGHLFQLRVGMDGEKEMEFIPIHHTAFAERLNLEPAHQSLADVQFELSRLLEWISGRMRGMAVVS